jgi:hypothetical protein
MKKETYKLSSSIVSDAPEVRGGFGHRTAIQARMHGDRYTRRLTHQE